MHCRYNVPGLAILLTVGGLLPASAGCVQRAAPAGETQPSAGAGEAPQTPRPVAAAPPVSASPLLVADAAVYRADVRPFFARHCVKCHGPRTAEADLRLDTLPADFVNRPAADHWLEVLDRINLGEMPPEDEPRPDAAVLDQVTDWIADELQQAQRRSHSTGGRVVLRRLTRLEYAATVRDLLNVDFVSGEGPLKQLPPDGSIAGFDRLSKALLLDPSLMEAYLTVARRVADRAVVFRPPPTPQRTLRFKFDRTPDTAMAYILHDRRAQLDDGLMVIMEASARTFGKLRHPFNDKEIPVAGKYRIRVRAAAQPGVDGEPVYMDVTYGSAGRQARFRVDARRDAPQVYEFEKTFDAFTPGEFQVAIVGGTRFSEGNAEWYHRHRLLTEAAAAGDLLDSTRMKARMRAEGAYDHHVRSSYLPGVLDLDRLPKLYLDWIEVAGPLQGEFPPPSLKAVFPIRRRPTASPQPSTIGRPCWPTPALFSIACCRGRFAVR